MTGPLSGYLLASPSDNVVTRKSLTTTSDGSQVLMEFVAPFESTKFWEKYQFESDRSFTDEEAERSRPPYRYPVYCARSGSKLVILTEKKRLTDYVIGECLNRTIFPNLKHVTFNVEKMIAALQEADSRYRLTSLHGRFAGPGRDLRTMILYGPQVTNSAVFREHQNLFNFYICGVAERLPTDPFYTGEDGEIARIGNDGSISIQSLTRKRATDLNKIINYLISNKWVDDWVAPWEGSSE